MKWRLKSEKFANFRGGKMEENADVKAFGGQNFLSGFLVILALKTPKMDLFFSA